jgi:hypothetical protein
MAYDLPHAAGVLARHADECPARDGRRCTCGPIGYRAADGKRPIGPLVATPEEALSWRREQYAALDDAQSGDLLHAAVDDFLSDAAGGRALAPDGHRYTAGERHALRRALTRAVVPALGELPLRDVGARQLHELLDDLQMRLPAPQVQTVEDALREFFDYALDRGLIDADPFAAPRPARGHRRTPERATVPDEAIWLSLKVATVVFVLIALILVAESV